MTARPSETEAGETDESRGHREPPGENHPPATASHKSPGFTTAIKQLFRAVAEIVSHRLPEPEPSPIRRRRTEDTGHAAFRMAAATTGPRRRRSRIAAAAFVAGTFLWDTLDWLQQWDDLADTKTSLPGEDFSVAPRDYLYPHL